MDIIQSEQEIYKAQNAERIVSRGLLLTLNTGEG